MYNDVQAYRNMYMQVSPKLGNIADYFILKFKIIRNDTDSINCKSNQIMYKQLKLILFFKNKSLIQSYITIQKCIPLLCYVYKNLEKLYLEKNYNNTRIMICAKFWVQL